MLERTRRYRSFAMAAFLFLAACTPETDTPAHQQPDTGSPDGDSPDGGSPARSSTPSTEGSPGAAPAGTLASTDDLLSLLDAGDGRGLSEALEGLLLAGEPGRAKIRVFAARCDGDSARSAKLAQDRQLAFGLARLAHLHPAESLAVGLAALREIPPRAESVVWGQLLGYLPEFLRYHEERFAAERADLEALLVAQLPKVSDQTLYRMFGAVQRLGYEPPAEVLVGILDDPRSFTSHQAVLSHLIGRGTEGIRAIVDWLGSVTDFGVQTPRTAILLLGAEDDPLARQCVQQFLTHDNALARDGAVTSYFQRPRTLEDLPYALDYLNSGMVLRRKKYFVSGLRRRNPELLEALRATPEAIFRPDVRALLDQAVPIATPSTRSE